MRKRVFMGAMLLVLGWACASCGLIKMPFRVVGSVASHSYQAGKKVVKKATKPKAVAPTDPNAKPAEAAGKAKDDKTAPQPPTPPATGTAPEQLPDPNIPVPPVDLPTQPGDLLPPLPEELPPL